MLVLFLACLMGPLGVTHVFVWFGFVFVCFVGIWLFGLLRWVGFIVFWRWLLKDALGMVLSSWDPGVLAWVRPGLPPLSNLAVPVQHF